MTDTPTMYDLTTPYTPVALYFHDSDFVEYVREDASCVYKRIDETLTLAIEMDSNLPIGFRIKGFKNFYLKHIRPLHGRNDHFVELVPVLERLVAEAGERIDFPDLKRAYRLATDIAAVDAVKVDVEALAA